MMDNPFKITVYNKSFVRQGWITDPVYVAFTPRFNAQGSAELQLNADDPILEFVLAAGARLRVEYRGVHLMSGRVRARQGEFVSSGTVTVQLSDDWRVLTDTLAWVRPGGQLVPTSLEAIAPQSWAQTWLPGGSSDAGPDGTTQGQTGYYLWPDGSAASGGVVVNYAESAIKTIISANAVTRLGRPLTVATDLLRGGNARTAGVLPQVRMDQLEEPVRDLLDWSGLGLSFRQDATNPTINVDVFVPTSWPQTLTVQSGIIINGSWSTNDPEATRGVVGGPGEGVNRAFWPITTNTSLESTYGDVVEVFRDATSANIVWPAAITNELLKVAKYFLLRSEVSASDKTQFESYLNTAGAKGLSEGVPTSGLSLELSETEVFHFGGADGIQLGDTITATSQGLTFTDRITEATLSWDANDGLIVTPRVGQKTDDPDRQLAEAVAALARAQNRLSTSK